MYSIMIISACFPPKSHLTRTVQMYINIFNHENFCIIELPLNCIHCPCFIIIFCIGLSSVKNVLIGFQRTHFPAKHRQTTFCKKSISQISIFQTSRWIPPTRQVRTHTRSRRCRRSPTSKPTRSSGTSMACLDMVSSQSASASA